MLIGERVYRLMHIVYMYIQSGYFFKINITGWERTGQMLCIVDTSFSVLMTLRMCLRELCRLFTVWI